MPRPRWIHGADDANAYESGYHAGYRDAKESEGSEIEKGTSPPEGEPTLWVRYCSDPDCCKCNSSQHVGK